MRIALALLAAFAVAASSASADSVLVNTTDPITIPKKGQASPYPSRLYLQYVQGVITDVVVSLRGVSHSRPSDLDILLGGPSRGARSILMSDTCGSAVTSATWAFSDAFEPMPYSCFGYFYRPTDVLDATNPDSWGGEYQASLDRFIGKRADGLWKLWVEDDQAGESGRIGNGWTLAITTATPDAEVPHPSTPDRADPYPITRPVAGLTGVVSDVDVSLSGIYHERPEDMDMLLVGPQGQKVLLMSDACGHLRAKNASWRWDDEAPASMPYGDDSCASGASYKPTDVVPADQFAEPAPAGPYPTTLSAFDATDPNGEWKLYVADDGYLADGFFTDRFKLDITTRPRAKVAFAQAGIDITEGQQREVTITRSTEGGASPAAGAVTVTSAPRSATSGSDFKPVATTLEFAAGQTQKTVTVEALADALDEDAETFALTLDKPTGDARPETQETALVTIRDPAQPPAAGAASSASPEPMTPAAPAGDQRADGPAPRVDRDAPVIGGITLGPGAVRYTLSEAAAVTLAVQRRAGGRYVTVRTLRRAGRAGPNRVALRLRRGAYRLVVAAADAAGNRSTPVRRRFRISASR